MVQNWMSLTVFIYQSCIKCKKKTFILRCNLVLQMRWRFLFCLLKWIRPYWPLHQKYTISCSSLTDHPLYYYKIYQRKCVRQKRDVYFGFNLQFMRVILHYSKSLLNITLRIVNCLFNTNMVPSFRWCLLNEYWLDLYNLLKNVNKSLTLFCALYIRNVLEV